MSLRVEPMVGVPGWFSGVCFSSPDNKLASIIKLLQETEAFLSAKGLSIHLDSLRLDHPYDSDGSYQIFFDYYDLDEESIELQRRNALQLQDRFTKPYAVSKTGTKELTRLEVCNNLPAIRGNSGRLLQYAVKELLEYKNAVIEDVSLIDWLDDDALVNPRLRIYLRTE